MTILVVLSSKDDRFQGENLLAKDYPGAERVSVVDRESLVQALQQAVFRSIQIPRRSVSELRVLAVHRLASLRGN